MRPRGEKKKMAPKQRGKEKVSNSCEDCGKDVSSEDKALICSICDKWFHIKCQRVSVGDYDFLQKTDESIQWFCKQCKGASQKLFKMMTMVHKRQDQLETEVKNLSAIVSTCSNKLDTQSKTCESIGEQVNNIHQQLPHLITEKVGEILSDRQEVEAREENFIIFNLNESEGKESRKKDVDLLQDIFTNILKVENVHLEDITRLGRYEKDSDKMRPVRVAIKNRVVRGQILRNAHKLKNSETFKKVGIGRDLTKKQREANKALRKQLLKLKKDEPENNWAIRRDKLVKLPPPSLVDRGDRSFAASGVTADVGDC